ncbi:hypothetical protein HDU76_004875, partial [Blyttiomyces sp. JEL0837]
MTITSTSTQQASTTGRDTLIVTIDNLPRVLNLSCSFGEQQVLPATRIDTTHIQCKTPSSTPGNSTLSIWINNQRASINSVPFYFSVVCPMGSYLSGDACKSCPKGGFCVGGWEPPVSAKGYYPSPVVDNVFLECFTPDSCAGNNTCSVGYDGPRCVYCTEGYSNVNGNCIVCDGTSSQFVAFLFVAFVLILPLWWLNRAVYRASNASFSSLLMFVQVLGLFQK